MHMPEQCACVQKNAIHPQSMHPIISCMYNISIRNLHIATNAIILTIAAARMQGKKQETKKKGGWRGMIMILIVKASWCLLIQKLNLPSDSIYTNTLVKQHVHRQTTDFKNEISENIYNSEVRCCQIVCHNCYTIYIYVFYILFIILYHAWQVKYSNLN